MVKKYVLIIVCLALFEFVKCQEYINEHEYDKNFSNIVKEIVFESQGKYYPLTVLLCPYGYWEYSQIRFGKRNYYKIEYLSNISFGWKSNGESIKTPNTYIYDTLKSDTIFSLFENLMCTVDKLSLPINPEDKVVNFNARSNLYSNLISEFKYTYLLKNIEVNDNQYQNIRILYPVLSENGYKDYFNLVNLKLMKDSIEMTSYVINTVNLFDIKVEKKRSYFIIGREYKRLTKRISKTTFNKSIVCNGCNQPPYNQLDFLIDYSSNKLNYSYFLCEGIVGSNKNQNEIIYYLQGLKHTIVYLNEKYFSF